MIISRDAGRIHKIGPQKSYGCVRGSINERQKQHCHQEHCRPNQKHKCQWIPRGFFQPSPQLSVSNWPQAASGRKSRIEPIRRGAIQHHPSCFRVCHFPSPEILDRKHLSQKTFVFFGLIHITRKTNAPVFIPSPHPISKERTRSPVNGNFLKTGHIDCSSMTEAKIAARGTKS